MVDESQLVDDSLHPFEVSRSKRSLDLEKRGKRGVSYHPLLKTLSPDRHFDWQSVIHQIATPVKTDGVESKDNTTHKKIYRMIPLSMKLMTKLGVKILYNRRLCFGGRAIKGIFLPRNRTMQIELTKRFLVWFSPCIEFSDKKYRINEICMKRREYEFLKMYLQSVGYHHPSWKNPKSSSQSYVNIYRK